MKKGSMRIDEEMLRSLHRDGDPGDVNDEAQYKDDRGED
jgi:hypothetical protein